MPGINIYVSHLTNKKCNRVTIDFDDHIYSFLRRGYKASYRENYDDELKACFRENGVGFKPYQAMVWLKEKLPEVVGATELPSAKYIKNNYSALKP